MHVTARNAHKEYLWSNLKEKKNLQDIFIGSSFYKDEFTITLDAKRCKAKSSNVGQKQREKWEKGRGRTESIWFKRY